MWTEPAYSRYEALLKRLHELNRQGKQDSPEADLVRQAMDALWSRLSEADKALLAGLSSDLSSLAGKELIRDAEVDERVLVARTCEAFEHGNWFGLLEALRYTHQHIPSELVAYMRGRCWQELGRSEAAFWFFERAFGLSRS
jgi:hypothetical protein